MLELIQIEFMKLRRRKLIWIMMLASLVMPFMAMLLFNYRGEKGVDPMQFYRWSALSFTVFIILPVVLGILCSMLIHEENQHDMLKQFFIVPVSKMGFFLSKFFVILIFSVCFMLITAIASVAFSVIPGYVKFDMRSILYLIEKCMEIGVLSAFAILPILSIAVAKKGYIFPICVTLVYSFCSFILMSINMYLLPITSMAVIMMRNKDIPGVIYTQELNIPLALLCICIWDIGAILLAKIALKRK